MRVLFIEPCFVDFGGYFRAINICTHLARKGVTVDLLVASKKRFAFSVKKTILNENLVQYELPRFDFHFFFNGRLLRAALALAFGLTRKYDVIHACVPVQLESNIPAFFFRLLRKNVVMDWDDYWEASTIYGEYRIMKRYVAFCERRAPAFFGNMIVVSELLKELALARGATRVLKLINGVNQEQFAPQDRTASRKKLDLDMNGLYLLAFGNTYINDRAYLLLKTFELIYQREHRVRLLISFDPRSFIQSANPERKIDPRCLENIINVGYIPQERLGYYLGACDAAIFIVGDSDNERANFPIRIGSYLNGGAVVIMNDVNSEAGNVLKQNHCAIIEKDLEVLAEKSASFLRDPRQREELARRVQAARSALSWEKLVEELLIFYREVQRGRIKRKYGA